MKPVPSSLLCFLILALCGLCAWQWHRESRLREIATSLRTEMDRIVVLRDELEARAKSADAEILRLTGALAELRQNSVAAQVHNDLLAADTQLREDLVKQNTAIKQQADALTQANAAIMQANETMRTLAAERDGLVQKVNEVTTLYNALAAKRE